MLPLILPLPVPKGTQRSSNKRAAETRPMSAKLLFEAIGNPALGQVIGCHFHLNLVPRQNTNAVLAHAACGMRYDFVVIFQLHAEGGIWQQFSYDTGKFQYFFFRHKRFSILLGCVCLRKAMHHDEAWA